MRRSALLIAVLVYVSLDLSLPAMPGAFVFDPGDSVESIQRTRVRGTAEAVMPPAPAGDAFVLSQVPRDTLDRRAATGPAPVRPRVPRRSGGLDEPAPPSEDPY